MNTDIKFMLSVIGAVITGTELPDEPDDADWEYIYKTASMHNVANIVGYAVSGGRYNVCDGLQNLFLKQMYEKVMVDENQKAAINELYRFFDEAQIAYMPLKGAVIKGLYASTDMRCMSDADILIKTEEYHRTDELMKSLGYEFVKESNHEYIYKKPPFVNIELHKILVPSYNEDLYAYYGDGWKLAKKVDTKSQMYRLSKEDEFVYLITHFAKHYRDAGIGIKQATDIWIYAKTYRDIDMTYTYEQLKKLKLDRFYDNLAEMLRVWFEDADENEMSEYMTNFIVNSGEFGTSDNNAAAKVIRGYQNKNMEELKRNRYFRLLFPNLAIMKGNYPILAKKPYLLPAMWIYRIFRVILKKDVKAVKSKADNYVNRDLEKYFEHMRKVGLDIYNGRKDK